MNRSQACKILGVLPGSTPEEVKKAYRTLSSKHHPDKHQQLPEAEQKVHEEKFKQAKEAFETLEKPVSNNPFADFSANAGSADDLWAKFNFYHERAANNVKPGQDRIFNATIDITLKEAFNGIVKTTSIIGYPQPIVVDIPAGTYGTELLRSVEVGTNIYRIYPRIKDPNITVDDGLPDPSTRGNTRSDLHVPVLMMITGAWLEVEMIDGGKVNVRIPAGLESHKLLKVKDRGYWKGSNRKLDRGDHFFRVIPVIKKLDDLTMEEIRLFMDALNEKISPGDGVSGTP